MTPDSSQGGVASSNKGAPANGASAPLWRQYHFFRLAPFTANTALSSRRVPGCHTSGPSARKGTACRRLGRPLQLLHRASVVPIPIADAKRRHLNFSRRHLWGASSGTGSESNTGVPGGASWFFKSVFARDATGRAPHAVAANRHQTRPRGGESKKGDAMPGLPPRSSAPSAVNPSSNLFYRRGRRGARR